MSRGAVIAVIVLAVVLLAALVLGGVRAGDQAPAGPTAAQISAAEQAWRYRQQTLGGTRMAILTLLETLGANAKSVWGSLPPNVKTALQRVGEAGASALKSLQGTAAGAALVVALQALAGAIAGAAGAVQQTLSDLGPGARRALRAALGNIRDQMMAAGDRIEATIKSILGVRAGTAGVPAGGLPAMPFGGLPTMPFGGLPTSA